MNKKKQDTNTKNASNRLYDATNKMPMPMRTWLIAIIILTAIAFSASFTNGFTNWDDADYITSNSLIRSLSFDNIITIFKTPQVMGNYHPLAILSLAVDYNLFQLSPEGYHIHSVLLHILSIIFLFLLVQALFKQSFITIITTVLFAIHPLRVESVAWASERKDELYVLYYLAGLLAYLYYIDKNKIQYALLVVLCFVLSLLSKGQAVTFPLALFIIDYIRGKKIAINDILLFKLPLLVLSVIAGITAIHAQQATLAITPIAPHNLPERLLFACYGLGQYLFKLFMPINLSAFYPYPGKTNGSYSMWIYAGISAPIALVLLVWLCRKQRIVVSGILFFLLNIILLLQILPVGNTVVSERYTYLAYTGLFWALGYGVYILTVKYASYKAVIISICAVYGAWLSYTCYNRTLVWHDSETLWKDVIETYPNEPTARNNLGTYYVLNNRPDEAIAQFEKAIKLKPGYYEVLTNLSDIYRKAGKLQQALTDANAAVSIKPTYSTARINRGVIYAALKKFDSAMLDFRWVLMRQPNDTMALIGRCAIFSQTGRNDSAILDANHILSIDPDNSKARQNRGIAYVMTRQPAKAYDDFSWQIEHDPNNADAYSNRGILDNMLNHPDDAIKDFDRCLALNPTLYDAYGQRARAWLIKGDNAHAIQDATIAIKYIPGNSAFWLTRANAYKASGQITQAQHDYSMAKRLGTPQQ